MKEGLPMDRSLILAGAERAFFKALLTGYAGGEMDSGVQAVSKEKTEYGRKVTVLVNDDFTVIDEWDVTPFTDCSGGRTTILFLNIPIWLMFYLGSYPKEAIPTLKTALGQNYRAGIFNGGRGPDNYSDNIFSYENFVKHGSSFANFHGEERIYSRVAGGIVGYHEYMGKALI